VTSQRIYAETFQGEINVGLMLLQIVHLPIGKSV